MLYSSQNGCFFYYDSVLYSWKIAEPTLLFLLGLEAVTSYEKSLSDSIIISKYIYKTSTDALEPLEYIGSIYDDIYSFLSKFGSVEDFEHYLKFNCFGLKLLLNEITGTGTDRTVPVIFKSDSNRSLLNITTSESNLSYYDLQANKIYSIFNDVGYDTSLYNKEKAKIIAEYSIQKDNPLIKNILNSSSKEYRKIISKDINIYNNRIDEAHQSRITNSEIYRLLDYKAMYSYALGVLYGCKCLGYSDRIIWRLDPKYWYKDTYFNLVRTAWHVFRFHWTVELKDITGSTTPAQFNEKYKSIQDNKLWNFVNSADDLGGISLAKDELPCFCMYLHDNTNASKQVIYSASANELDQLGSYLAHYQLNNKLYWKWVPVTTGDSDNEPVVSDNKGLVSSKDTVLIRYFGNDPVYLYKAFEYEKGKYLSPKIDETYKNYYVYTGNLGWINYNPNQIVDTVDSEHDPVSGLITEPKHTYLYILPKSVDKNSLEYAISKNEDNTKPKSVITYYKCYFPSDNGEECVAHLYGIYNKYINKSKDTIPSNFDEIISDKLFKDKYDDSKNDPADTGYSSKMFYDLSSPIYLYVRQDSTDKSLYFIYDGSNDHQDDFPISHYGYSATPSVEITLFSNGDAISAVPKSDILRYNKDYNKYWSSSFFVTDEHGWNIWHLSSDVNLSSVKSFYLSTDKSTYLYKGEKKITELVDTDIKVILTTIYNKFSSSDSHKYVYIDVNNALNISSIKSYKFIEIGGYSDNINNYKETLYYNGITPNLCTYVLIDDDGNSLVDSDNNPLVWYDHKYNVYWNGLFGINRWQVNKPKLLNSIMYNSLTDEIKQAHNDSTLRQISVDGITYSYEEFYSNMHYGIVTEKLKVFNPDVEDEGIIECYHDTNSEYDRYIIPNKPEILPEWVSRSGISATGYWFVDGTETLYDGETPESVVIDDDHRD